MNCPICKKEMLGHLCSTETCPLYQVWLDEGEIDAISRVIAAEIDAARSQALQEAAQVLECADELRTSAETYLCGPRITVDQILYNQEEHSEDTVNLAAGIRAYEVARALAAQPAAAPSAPACPNCGVTGQVSGPGTATLCMACGAVMP